MIGFEIKDEVLGEITAGEARENESFISNLNYLVEEGFIEIEESDNGEIRLYPTTYTFKGS